MNSLNASAGSSGGGSNNEIDTTLGNAPNPAMFLILEAFDDPQEFAIPSGPAEPEPTSPRDQLSITTQEARNWGIILAPRRYTLNIDQSNVESEEEDYGDSDDEEVEAVFEDLEADVDAMVEVVEAVAEDVEVNEDVDAVVEDVGHAINEEAGQAVNKEAGHSVDNGVESVAEEVEAADKGVDAMVEDIEALAGDVEVVTVEEDVDSVVENVGHAMNEEAGQAVKEEGGHAVNEGVESVVEEVEAADKLVDAMVEGIEALTRDIEVVIVEEDVDAVVENVDHVMDEEAGHAVVEEIEAVFEELVSGDQEADTNVPQQIKAPTGAETTIAVYATLEPVTQSSDVFVKELLQVQDEYEEHFEELHSAKEEADQVEAGVTNQAFSNISANQQEVNDHKDVDIMLVHMAGASPGGSHTMNSALKLSQVGETSKVASIMVPILHQQEDQDDGIASDQKRRRLGVDKDASDSTTENSSLPSTCT